MNIKTLLTTTAIAAMAATAANATITLTPVDVADSNTTTDVAVTRTLANELNLDPLNGGANLTGVFGYKALFAAVLPQEQLKIKIDLPTGVVFDGLVAVDPAGDTSGANALSALVDQDTATTAGHQDAALGLDNFTSAGLSTGGADGSNTVTLFFTPAATQTTILMNLSLKVTKDACPAGAGPLTVTVTTAAAGLSVEGGTDATPANVISCADAITSIVAAADGTDSKAALPDFKSVKVAGAGITADTASRAVIGTVTATLNGTPPSVNLAGTAFDAATHMGNTTFTVDLSDSSALVASGVKLTPDATTPGTPISGVAQAAPNTNKYDFTVPNASAASFTASAGTLALNFDTTTVIAARTASIGAITQTFTGGPTFVASKTFGSTVTLDDIKLENSTFGPFDWVGDATKASRNLFRFTGMSANSLSVDVTFSNSSAGSAFDGTETMTLTTVNGEGQIDSAALGAAHGDYGRADVLFTFSSNESGADVDRLILRGGVLSPFGNSTGGVTGTQGDD